MSDKQRGPDVMGLLVIVAVIALAGGVIYFVSRLPDAAILILTAAAALALTSLPLLVALAIITRGRGAPPARDDDRYADQPADQRSYILERRQAAQLAELELRETKIEYARELARAKMLPSANPTTPPPADPFDTFTPTARPAARQVVILGGDSDD